MVANSNRKKFSCAFCSRRFRLYRQLEAHINFHIHERPHFCTDCDRSWQTRQALYYHRQSAHLGIQYKCSKCSRLYSNYDTFRKHRRDFHKGKMINGEHSIKAERVTKISDKKHQLTESKSTTTTSPPLPSSRHKDQIVLNFLTPSPVPKRRATFSHVRKSLETFGQHLPSPQRSPTRLSNPSTPSTRKPFKAQKCIFCEKEFLGDRQFEKHMTTHTRERPYFCKYSNCDTTWKSSEALYRHIQEIHKRIKYRCAACLGIFRNYDCFRRHRKNAHGDQSKLIDGKHSIKGEIVVDENGVSKTKKHTLIQQRARMSKTIKKPFNCMFCKRSFRELRQLDMHMNSHTGERPYQCILCDSYFPCRHSLYKHRQKGCHHSQKKPKVGEEVSETNKSVDAPDTDLDDSLKSDPKLLSDQGKWIHEDEFIVYRIPENKNEPRFGEPAKNSASFESSFKVEMGEIIDKEVVGMGAEDAFKMDLSEDNWNESFFLHLNRYDPYN